MLAFVQLPRQLPPPPPPEIRVLSREQGNTININGQKLNSSWVWTPRNNEQPPRLWLPLELLENRLGFRRDGDDLVWFGQRQRLNELPSQSLGDEVSLDAWPWLNQLGITPERSELLLRAMNSKPFYCVCVAGLAHARVRSSALRAPARFMWPR